MVPAQVKPNLLRSVAIRMVAGTLLWIGSFGIAIQSARAQHRVKHAGSAKVFAKRNPAKRAGSTSGPKALSAQKSVVPQAPAKAAKEVSPISGKTKSKDNSAAEVKVSGEKDTGDKDASVDSASVAKDVSAAARFEVIAEDPSDFHYVRSDKSDPFLPPLITTPEGFKTSGTVLKSQPGSIEIPIVSPLQQYELNQLNVVGVWQLATGERKAMILAPANNGGGGQGIIVKAGDPVGNRGGKITSIGEEYVNVREFMLAPDGSRRYLDQKMQMGKKEADEAPRKIRFTPGAARTTLVKENQAGFEKILDEERQKQNPEAVVPNHEQPLNAPVAPPVAVPVAAPEARGAADVPAAAEKDGMLELVKKMLMGGEGAKGGLGGQAGGEQNVQANADDKATTAFRDLQKEKAPEATPKLETQDKAPADAGNPVRKVF